MLADMQEHQVSKLFFKMSLWCFGAGRVCLWLFFQPPSPLQQKYMKDSSEDKDALYVVRDAQV